MEQKCQAWRVGKTCCCNDPKNSTLFEVGKLSKSRELALYLCVGPQVVCIYYGFRLPTLKMPLRNKHQEVLLRWDSTPDGGLKDPWWHFKAFPKNPWRLNGTSMDAMSTEKHLLNPSVRSKVIFWTEDGCIERKRERERGVALYRCRCRHAYTLW